MQKCKECIYAKKKHDPYYVDGIRYICTSKKSICLSATKREPKSLFEKIKIVIETKLFD